MDKHMQVQSQPKHGQQKQASTRTSTPCSDDMTAAGELVGAVMSSDPRAQRYSPPEPIPCQYCGKPRHTKGIFLQNRILWMPYGPEPCDCEEAQTERAMERQAKEEAEAVERETARQAKERERIARIIGASGVSERFKRRTFATFQELPENVAAYKMATGYAGNFQRLTADPSGHERNGLFIIGPCGTGKTHLAAAIANKLMADGIPVIFVTMIDLLAKIKATFAADRVQTTANEADLMRLYKTVDLLILDDMGKELPTPWALAKMYEIINARYEDYKPIIVTSNYTADELVKRLTPPDGDPRTSLATVERINEMTYTTVLAGSSWRTR